MYVCMYVCMIIGTGRRSHIREFAALVRVVQLAHGLGIFHRDISISNIFYGEEGECIFLNDWSSAHCTTTAAAKPSHRFSSSSGSAAGNSVKWVGTRYFSCSKADENMNHVPTAADDLRSLVKCAQISYCNQPTPLPGTEERYFECEIMQDSYWRKAWDLAGNSEYQALVEHFERP